MSLANWWRMRPSSTSSSGWALSPASSTGYVVLTIRGISVLSRKELDNQLFDAFCHFRLDCRWIFGQQNFLGNFPNAGSSFRSSRNVGAGIGCSGCSGCRPRHRVQIRRQTYRIPIRHGTGWGRLEGSSIRFATGCQNLSSGNYDANETNYYSRKPENWNLFLRRLSTSKWRNSTNWWPISKRKCLTSPLKWWNTFTRQRCVWSGSNPSSTESLLNFLLWPTFCHTLKTLPPINPPRCTIGFTYSHERTKHVLHRHTQYKLNLICGKLGPCSQEKRWLLLLLLCGHDDVSGWKVFLFSNSFSVFECKPSSGLRVRWYMVGALQPGMNSNPIITALGRWRSRSS